MNGSVASLAGRGIRAASRARTSSVAGGSGCGLCLADPRSSPSTPGRAGPIHRMGGSELDCLFGTRSTPPVLPDARQVDSVERVGPCNPSPSMARPGLTRSRSDRGLETVEHADRAAAAVDREGVVVWFGRAGVAKRDVGRRVVLDAASLYIGPAREGDHIRACAAVDLQWADSAARRQDRMYGGPVA